METRILVDQAVREATGNELAHTRYIGLVDKIVDTVCKALVPQSYAMDDPDHPVPKDGTAILVAFDNAEGGEQVCCARWVNEGGGFWRVCVFKHAATGIVQVVEVANPKRWRPVPPV